MGKNKVHNKYIFKFCGTVEVDGFGDTEKEAYKNALDNFIRLNFGDLKVTEYRTIVTIRMKDDK